VLVSPFISALIGPFISLAAGALRRFGRGAERRAHIRRIFHEDQPVSLRMRDAEPHIGVSHRLETLRRIGNLRERLEGGKKLRIPLRAQRARNLVAACEVQVQRGR
jgi:hypothetical protein